MQAVLISSQPYDSYASVEQADDYLAAALHAGTDWSDATADTKGRALVTATRVLDRQNWLAAYDTQAERAAVVDIQNASIEMALALIQGSELQSETSTAQKLSSIKAGSVALTYFRGASTEARRFPQIVDELLRAYLAGASLAVGPKATGVDGVSSTEDDFGHTGGI